MVGFQAAHVLVVVPLQDPKDLQALPRDLLYMARQMKCQLPPRPVQTRPEQRLFIQLYRSLGSSANNFRRFADLWNTHTSAKDGVLPKLPVHLRLYWKRFLFNSRLKDMARTQQATLAALNARLSSDHLGTVSVGTPGRMERPVRHAESEGATVDVGPHSYHPVQPVERREASAELDGGDNMDNQHGR